MRRHQEDDCGDFLLARRRGFLVGHAGRLMSFNVAWKAKAFGEGAERLAFKFRFLDQKGSTFQGPIMVAKESRFVEDTQEAKNYLRSHKHAYHKTFMRTQSTAAKFARTFNRRLADTVSVEELKYMPEIQFVKPYIFELGDEEACVTYNVLVEPMIQGQYRKFSDNHGDLAPDVKRDFVQENQGVDLVSAAMLLGRTVSANTSNNNEANEDTSLQPANALDVIPEGDEEEKAEEEDDEKEVVVEEEYADEDNTSFYALMRGSQVRRFDPLSVADTDYLQAFSHFSYEESVGKVMVVDLQGALQPGNSQKGLHKTFILTDPAIHQRNGSHSRNKTKRKFGRTDLGVRGMKAFFNSHVCNDVCRLLQLRDHQRSANVGYSEQGKQGI